jgi:hypothetical protein
MYFAAKDPAVEQTEMHDDYDLEDLCIPNVNEPTIAAAAASTLSTTCAPRFHWSYSVSSTLGRDALH